MPADMFLKLEGIPGESLDSKHSGEIEILSYSWGASQMGTFAGGGGGGAPMICSSTQRPRLTGDVRVGFEVTVNTLACVSNPPRTRSCKSTRTNWSPRIGCPRFAGFAPMALPFVSAMP